MFRFNSCSMLNIVLLLLLCTGNALALPLEVTSLEEAKTLAEQNNALIYFDFYSPN